MLKQLKDKKVIFFDVGNTLDRPASGHWMFTNRFYEVAAEATLFFADCDIVTSEANKQILEGKT